MKTFPLDMSKYWLTIQMKKMLKIEASWRQGGGDVLIRGLGCNKCEYFFKKISNSSGEKNSFRGEFQDKKRMFILNYLWPYYLRQERSLCSISTFEMLYFQFTKSPFRDLFISVFFGIDIVMPSPPLHRRRTLRKVLNYVSAILLALSSVNALPNPHHSFCSPHAVTV